MHRKTFTLTMQAEVQKIEKEVEAEAKKISDGLHAFCLKCKLTKEVKDPQQIETSNKRLRVSGTCPDCGNKVSQFLKSPASENAVEAPKQ